MAGHRSAKTISSMSNLLSTSSNEKAKFYVFIADIKTPRSVRMKSCCFELIISVLRANSLMIHHDRSYISRLAAEVSVDCGVNTRLPCNRHRCKPSFVISTKSKVSKRRRRVRLRAKFAKIIYHAFLDGKFRPGTNRFSDVLLLFIR